MQFEVLNKYGIIPSKAKNKVYLIWDDWNDYSFYTLFWFIYVDSDNARHKLGAVKFGFVGQKEHERVFKIGDVFDHLEEGYFSLGQDPIYYNGLNKLGDDLRDEILESLNDIAKKEDIYKVAILERVTKISFLREISQTSVIGQFRRLANGGVSLSRFDFEYKAPKLRGSSSQFSLRFNVEPESNPPTNIHVLIGRNGVGKTRLLNNMIKSLVEDEGTSVKYGSFTSTTIDDDERLFANVVSVTFSAFDESEPLPEKKDKTKSIQYSYIGLRRAKSSTENNLAPKSTIMLKNEFVKSYNSLRAGSKASKWKRAIDLLKIDQNFQDLDIPDISDYPDPQEFVDSLGVFFSELSSGHKIVLLTITRLIEAVEERSLVLIDEPEGHLHPPLLSAFIRVLSDLLVDRNAVAIIATHSPVVLQEVPRSCVWKLRRIGSVMVTERLTGESFGENVSTLTKEVFGLEVTHSGYHKLLIETIDKFKSYNAVIEQFNGQLGMDAKAIARALTVDNQNDTF